VASTACRRWYSARSRLIQVDPISGKESEQYPASYPKEYRERVEKFSRNYIWRKITGDVTIEFLEAAVDRMFTADEVFGVVDRVSRTVLGCELPGALQRTPSNRIRASGGPYSIRITPGAILRINISPSAASLLPL
jgi:hypothetical protein